MTNKPFDVSRCVVVSPDSPDTITKLLEQWKISRSWEGTTLQVVLFPLLVLRLHVADTTKALAELLHQVGEAENQIQNPSQDLAKVIRTLHRCNTQLVKLDRRWHFEQRLSAAISEAIEKYKSHTSRISELHRQRLELHWQRLYDFSILQKSLSKASEYDLSVLPRRIENQFTAIYNLIAQGDTKATISLAEASKRDSSSMKTIAGMTLIFLPPTFICSFFSMSFFNFEATGTKSLWVYVATAAPLTVVVILTWIAYNLWSRDAEKKKKKKHKLEDPESRSE